MCGSILRHVPHTSPIRPPRPQSFTLEFSPRSEKRRWKDKKSLRVSFWREDSVHLALRVSHVARNAPPRQEDTRFFPREASLPYFLPANVAVQSLPRTQRTRTKHPCPTTYRTLKNGTQHVHRQQHQQPRGGLRRAGSSHRRRARGAPDANFCGCRSSQAF